MIKKLAELKVSKSADYYDKVANTLKEAGFILILDCEVSTDRYYIIAREESEVKNAGNN